jgi:hypothetical protein
VCSSGTSPHFQFIDWVLGVLRQIGFFRCREVVHLSLCHIHATLFGHARIVLEHCEKPALGSTDCWHDSPSLVEIGREE